MADFDPLVRCKYGPMVFVRFLFNFTSANDDYYYRVNVVAGFSRAHGEGRPFDRVPLLMLIIIDVFARGEIFFFWIRILVHKAQTLSHNTSAALQKN